MPKTNLHRKPIEKLPLGPRLPLYWYAQHHYGIPYRTRDKPVQEDWGSVARKFGVPVRELIFFNFMTLDPAEVNWYLSHHTGCNKPSPSGDNWMFSNSANPGIIYIPPPEDRVNFAPEVLCVWIPTSINLFMQRLRVIAQSIPGLKGARIRKFVQIILRVGYPRCLDLWYYNDINITEYVDWKKTTPAVRRDMTKATQGVFPFDGESGFHGGGGEGSDERQFGMWRIHPVKDLFDEFACGTWSVATARASLESIEQLMYDGWYAMLMVGAHSTMGGGNLYDPALEQFLYHVKSMTNDDDSLYSIFRQ